MVVVGIQLFGFGEDRMINKHVKVKEVSVKKLHKVMTRPRTHVEEKIKQMLPDTIAVVFEGWTCGSCYLVAVFAFFKFNNDCRNEQAMLSFSTFADKTGHTAQEHMLFMEHVLSTYGMG